MSDRLSSGFGSQDIGRFETQYAPTARATPSEYYRNARIAGYLCILAGLGYWVMGPSPADCFRQSGMRGVAGCTLLIERGQIFGFRSIDENRRSVIYRNRGLHYARMGKFDLGILDYNRSLEINPEYGGAYISRGTAYNLKGRDLKAEADYRSAIRVGTSRPNVPYYNLGTIYSGRLQFEKGIEYYSKAIALKPDDIDSMHNRAWNYEQLFQYHKALDEHARIIGIDANNHKAHIQRGRVFILLKRLDKTIEYYSKAIEIRPKYARGYVFRGRIYERLNEMEPAISDYTKAIEAKRSYRYAYRSRSVAFAKVQNYDRALEDFERGICTGAKSWVKPMQTGLKRHGLYHGEIDGKYHASTKTALLSCLKKSACRDGAVDLPHTKP